MARCEDFPCCGHEAGCCPDFDSETGKQLNMKCVCGATVPLGSRSSLCAACLSLGEDLNEDGYQNDEDYDDNDGEFNDYDEHSNGDY